MASGPRGKQKKFARWPLASTYSYSLSLHSSSSSCKVAAQFSARLVVVLVGREGHFVIFEIRLIESLFAHHKPETRVPCYVFILSKN